MYKISQKIISIKKMMAYTLILIVAILAISMGSGASSMFSILNFKKIWFQRPYDGPEVVIEIIGADMNHRANRLYDYWSPPDILVSIHHGDTTRHTQIEGNTYQPRFLWKTKMPYQKTMGIHFHVMEENVIKGDEVMGRAFIDNDRIADMMRTKESGLLSLGENIGVLKIVISPAPADLKEGRRVKQLDGPVAQPTYGTAFSVQSTRRPKEEKRRFSLWELTTLALFWPPSWEEEPHECSGAHLRK